MAVTVGALALAAQVSAQTPPSPAPTFQQLPPQQPPLELAKPPARSAAPELPKPVASPCMRERTVPCADDPKKECKVVEIADCK